jgi:Uma2 family endonuclease
MALEPQHKLTYEDYVRLPDDGRRWELFDGEAFMVPSPDVEHQDVLMRLARQIWEYLDRYGGGRVFVAPLDVVLSEENIFQPDVIFVADADASVITEKHIRGAPTWVIEVVSDPVRDRRDKREKYMRFGISEYWTVDPELRQVAVFRPNAAARVMEPPGQLAPNSLPGLLIDLDMVFGPDRRPRRL